MRKKLNTQITKSDLENQFEWYCEELKRVGMIKSFTKYPSSKILSEPVYYRSNVKATKSKIFKNKTLLNDHYYTPDFIIVWEKCARNIFWRRWEEETIAHIPFLVNYKSKTETSEEMYYSVIEIKPGFDMENMTRLFSINQKWVMQVAKIYVQKFLVTNDERCIFAKTFTPIKWLLTPTGKSKTIHFPVQSVSDYIEKRKKLFEI